MKASSQGLVGYLGALPGDDGSVSRSQLLTRVLVVAMYVGLLPLQAVVSAATSPIALPLDLRCRDGRCRAVRRCIRIRRACGCAGRGIAPARPADARALCLLRGHLVKLKR